MNVLIVISSFFGSNSGRGGHYRSATDIGMALQTLGHNVTIANIGDFAASALHNCPLRSIYVSGSCFHRAKLVSGLMKIAKQEATEIVHAFDMAAYAYSRRLSKLMSLPLVLTKAGGTNPPSYFPKAKHLVVFSRENLQWFQNNPRFEETRVVYIPQRVFLATLVHPTSTSSSPHIRILCVANAVETKLIQFQQAVEIGKSLMEAGFKVKVRLIFGKHSAQIEKELLLMRNEFVEVEAWSPELTREQLMSTCDIVVAMGRGVMEGAGFGKIVMVSVHQRRTPVLLRPDTIDALEASNFSARSRCATCSESESVDALKALLSSESAVSKYSSWVQKVFSERYSAEKGAKMLVEIYGNASPACRINPLDYAKESVYLLLPGVMSRVRRLARGTNAAPHA